MAIEEGADRTLDDLVAFGKTVQVQNFSAQQTIYELRQTIAAQENMAVEDVNIFVKTTHIPDNAIVGDCMVEWLGSGLEAWPPQFMGKTRVKGFEIHIDVPAMRDTSVWKAGRCEFYGEKQLIFDVDAATKVQQLKDLIARKLKIPAARQLLTAQMLYDNQTWGALVPLSDDKKTLGDYEVDVYCVSIKLEKDACDENGMYVFDDAYFDSEGYHAQPDTSGIPPDSISNRLRPDANRLDPCQPTSILTDRRQAQN